jgi:hypothetical protein
LSGIHFTVLDPVEQRRELQVPGTAEFWRAKGLSRHHVFRRKGLGDDRSGQHRGNDELISSRNFFPRARVLSTKDFHETHNSWMGGENKWLLRRQRKNPRRSKLTQLNQDGAILPSWFVFYGHPRF